MRDVRDVTASSASAIAVQPAASTLLRLHIATASARGEIWNVCELEYVLVRKSVLEIQIESSSGSSGGSRGSSSSSSSSNNNNNSSSSNSNSSRS